LDTERSGEDDIDYHSVARENLEKVKYSTYIPEAHNDSNLYQFTCPVCRTILSRRPTTHKNTDMDIGAKASNYIPNANALGFRIDLPRSYACFPFFICHLGRKDY